MGTYRERPELRAEWRFDTGGAGGAFEERAYFRRYGCHIRATVRPDPRHGSWQSSVFLDGDCVHRSEHEGLPFAKAAAVGAAMRAVEIREAVCDTAEVDAESA